MNAKKQRNNRIARGCMMTAFATATWTCFETPRVSTAMASPCQTPTTPTNMHEEHKDEYVANAEPAIITVKPATYLAVRGKGEPGGKEFQKKVGMLYGVAYGLKAEKASSGKDFVIGALEAQWWAKGDDADFLKTPKSDWQWQLLIRVPTYITKQDIKLHAMSSTPHEAPTKELPVDLIFLEEGKCIQVMHTGPYTEEDKTISAMRDYAKKKNLTENGHHHEIYMNNPNTTPPEKLKTILRQPVKDQQ